MCDLMLHALILAMDCGSLESVPNGHVSFNETTLGNTVSYSCNPGYVLEGSASRLCEPVLVGWSGCKPTCKSKSDYKKGFALAH